MNALGLLLLGSMPYTRPSFALLGALFYLALRRSSPAAGALAAASSLSDHGGRFRGRLLSLAGLVEHSARRKRSRLAIHPLSTNPQTRKHPRQSLGRSGRRGAVGRFEPPG